MCLLRLSDPLFTLLGSYLYTNLLTVWSLSLSLSLSLCMSLCVSVCVCVSPGGLAQSGGSHAVHGAVQWHQTRSLLLRPALLLDHLRWRTPHGLSVYLSVCLSICLSAGVVGLLLCDLHLPRTERWIGDRAFFMAAPHAWNWQLAPYLDPLLSYGWKQCEWAVLKAKLAMRMRVSRDRVVGGHPKPHIWNQRPQFAYSLYKFYGATTTIKGSLHGSTPIVKRQNRAQKWRFFGNYGV